MYGRPSLRQLILVSIAIPVVAVVVGTAWLGLRAMEKHLERRLQEDVELVARAIHLPLRNALLEGDAEEVQRALDSAFRIGRVYGAYVYDTRGERVAAASTGDQGAPPDEIAGVAEGGEQGEYTEVGRRRVYSFFLPLATSGGEILGLLQVTRRRQEMEDHLLRVRVQAGLSTLTGVLLVVGVVLVGHHRAVGRPLSRLADSMRRVEEGDREHRADTDLAPREVARLAEGLNSMLESLVRSEREIESGRRSQLVLQNRLQRSERLAAIGQLAAGVAHELGTPLSIVDGHAQRALRAGDVSPEARLRWEAVRGECRRIEGIVQQLLAIGRQERPRRSRVSPERLVRGALSAARHAFDESGARVSVGESGVGPAENGEPTAGSGRRGGGTPPADVEVDRTRVEQALANLLRNAAQASPGGRVRLGWSGDGGRLVFTVDDDGPGIPRDRRTRVLQPFYTTKAPSEGTGLGLALVQSVADEHEGSVAVEDSPLGGARLVLTLGCGPPDGRRTAR